MTILKSQKKNWQTIPNKNDLNSNIFFVYNVILKSFNLRLCLNKGKFTKSEWLQEEHSTAHPVLAYVMTLPQWITQYQGAWAVPCESPEPDPWY